MSGAIGQSLPALPQWRPTVEGAGAFSSPIAHDPLNRRAGFESEYESRSLEEVCDSWRHAASIVSTLDGVLTVLAAGELSPNAHNA